MGMRCHLIPVLITSNDGNQFYALISHLCIFGEMSGHVLSLLMF